MIHEPCDTNEVNKIIKEFVTSKASGPYSIPTNLIKSTSQLLVPILTNIINKSLIQGKFPNLLKYANVCPIYKKNDVHKCENDRPISLLSNISKIFEKMMYSRLWNFLYESEIHFERQFGFRKNHSTNHAIISIVEEIRINLDNKLFTCGVFFWI